MASQFKQENINDMDEIYKAIIRQRCRYSDDINVLTIGASKKAEADKPVAAVVSKKTKEEKPSENLKETNQVNINQASAEELAKKLHGIGIQKAKAIVEYREKYGAFNTLENILEVRGIGPAFLEKNRGKLAL